MIVASGSCLEEAAGPSAPSVDPDDVEDWINTAKELFNYTESRDRLARQGQEYVSRFNDADMAEKTMGTYLRAIREHS